MTKIRKAILPVAGFGTRFLPATKAQPKEMLPIVDKPVIQYLVEEAVSSGIEEIIFVTGRGKRAIEDHFDKSFELEFNLVEKEKRELLKIVRNISKLANFVYIRQPMPLGDGDAILRARKLVGDEPVAVLFGDDLVDAEIPCLKQLMNVFEKYNDPVLAVEEVEQGDIDKYGIISGVQVEDRIFQVNDIIEKPASKEAPSNLGVVGKYILIPEIFEILQKKPKQSGEIRLVDALEIYVRSKPIYACQFVGRRYDCGSKLGFLKATVDLGLKHPEVGEKFKRWIKEKL